MGAGRFYAALSSLLFAAVCAYAGTALFTALEMPPAKIIPGSAENRAGELRGIVLRREETAPDSLIFPAGQRIPPGEHSGESALYWPDSDGLEYLSPSDCTDLSPQRLTELISAQPQRLNSAKLIYGFDCYYAAFYSGDVDIEPGPCRLRFESQTEIRRAELIQVSHTETQCALLFRLMLDGSMLDMRMSRAELIF